MKYFAKYLPVEGKIKNGDRVIDYEIAPDMILDYIEGDKFMNDISEEVTLPKWKTRFNFQKVKLFLCSRDIQVVDEAWFKDLNGEYQKETCNYIENYTNDCFKVIGEISPEAIWVKEGNEFDEDEVQEFWGQAETHQPMIKRLDKRFDEKLLKQNCPIVFKIKGPCGHFH